MRNVNTLEEYNELLPVNSEKLFGRTGDEISLKDKTKAYAKEVVSHGKPTYYLKSYNNAPFDPLGSYANRETLLETTLKKVNREVFDNYLIYLKTHRSIYLTKAQRLFNE